MKAILINNYKNCTSKKRCFWQIGFTFVTVWTYVFKGHGTLSLRATIASIVIIVISTLLIVVNQHLVEFHLTGLIHLDLPQSTLVRVIYA